jgi:hypothetical protein
MGVATILGTYFSLAGVLIAIWQLYKTKKISEATKKAVISTQTALTQNVFLIDISTIVRTIDEIKLQIRTECHESALLRVNDVICQLQQISSLPLSAEHARTLNITQAVVQLSILRDILEKNQHSEEKKINTSNVNSILSNISDRFHKVIGKTKYIIKAGENNA